MPKCYLYSLMRIKMLFVLIDA